MKYFKINNYPVVVNNKITEYITLYFKSELQEAKEYSKTYVTTNQFNKRELRFKSIIDEVITNNKANSPYNPKLTYEIVTESEYKRGTEC